MTEQTIVPQTAGQDFAAHLNAVGRLGRLDHLAAEVAVRMTNAFAPLLLALLWLQ